MARRRLVRRSLLLAVLTVALAVTAARAQESDLLVTKSGPDQAAADTDVTYMVSVLNVGPDASAAITLTDSTPPGMTFVSASPPGCTTPVPGNPGTITCVIATLSPGSSADFTFVFHIAAATPPGTFFTNVATASTATDSSDENNSGVQVTSTPPPAQADVGIVKSGPGSAGPDANVVFTIVVQNGGPDPATGVTWTDTLPGNLTFVSLAPNSGCSTPIVGAGGTVSCTIPTLAAGTGAAITYTLTAHVPAGTPSGTVYENEANISAATSDPNDENNTSQAVVTVSTVDVSVAKQGPGTVNAGDVISYSMVVANGGPDVAVNVNFFDILPPNTTFVSFMRNSGPAPASCSQPAVGATGTVGCTYATLVPGAPAMFTLQIRAGNTTSVENTLTITTDSFDTDQGNNSATAPTTVNPRADLAVVKTGPASVTAGVNASYTITVDNLGPSDATSVTITDVVTAPLTFVSLDQTSGPTFSCTKPAVGSVGTITCTIALLPVGGHAVFALVLRPSAAAAAGTGTANTAAVSTTTVDPVSDNNQSTASATVATSADVSVSKTGPATTVPGANVSYTVTVANAGPSDASTVSLTDAVPAGTTFVSASQPTGPVFSCTTPAPGGTGTITCNIAALPAGASATFAITVKVATGATGTVTNIANVSTTTSDSGSGNNSSTVTTTIVTADLAVAKSGPASVTAGSDAAYTITVNNGGASDAASVSLTDPLPPGTTFVSLNQTSGPTFMCTSPSPGATGTITCTIATLSAGTTATFSLVMRVAPDRTGTLANTANVSAATADPNSGNNASTTTAAPVSASADVGVVKTGPSSVSAGANVTYTVTVTNTGPSDASTVSLTDPLPAGTTFVSLNQTNGPSFTCATPAVGGTGTITCTRATLAAGATATFSLVVKVAAGATGSVANTANVSAATADSNPGNSSSTTTAAAAASADLGVAKTGPATALAGTNVTYTIVVTSAGPSDAAGVSLTDPLPAGTTFVSLSQTAGPGFACVSPAGGATGTVTCTIATLPAGAEARFTLVLNVSPGTGGSVTNTATVSATTSDPATANNGATAATSVSGADLSIVKTAQPLVGGRAEYTIVVTNQGPAVALNVIVTDVLAAGTTLESATTTQGSCAGTATVTCAVGTLAAGGAATITLLVGLPATATAVDNTATVISATSDPDSANNASTVSFTPVRGIPTLSTLTFAWLGITLAAVGCRVLRRRFGAMR